MVRDQIRIFENVLYVRIGIMCIDMYTHVHIHHFAHTCLYYACISVCIYVYSLAHTFAEPHAHEYICS